MDASAKYTAEEQAIIAKVRADPKSSFSMLLDYTDDEILEFYVPGQPFRLRAFEKEMLLARRKEAASAVLAGEAPDYATADQRSAEHAAKVFALMRGNDT